MASHYKKRVKKMHLSTCSELNVKWNFGDKSMCPLCNVKEDQQEHLLECILIKVRCPKLMENRNQCKYSDIYSSDIKKENNVSELLLEATRSREIYLSKKR